MRTIIGSILFQILFYLNSALIGFYLCATVWFLPKSCERAAARYWVSASLFLMRVLCGLKTECVDIHKIPQAGALVACKHQSYWDIFALLAIVPDPCFVSKKELLDIPLFGFFAKRHNVIGIDRSKGRHAISLLRKDAVERLNSGCNVVVFPEGTRRPVGAAPRYRYGVIRLYVETGCPIVPVGLHSGSFWPAKQLLIKPGIARLVVGDPIEPGIEQDQAQRRMVDEIEALSERARTM